MLGKYFAMTSVLLVPTIAFFMYPLILSKYGTINYLSAVGGILAFFMLGAMLISVGLFISTLTENQIIAAVVCFIVLFISYSMSGIISLIEKKPLASVIAFTIVVAIFSLIIKMMAKNLTIALVVGICLEAALLILYILNSLAFEGTFAAVLSVFAAFEKIEKISDMGLFDLKAFLYYISVSAMFLFLATQSLEKRRWS